MPGSPAPRVERTASRPGLAVSEPAQLIGIDIVEMVERLIRKLTARLQAAANPGR